MLISHVTTTIRTNQRSLYSGMAVSSLREHARPEVTKSSPFAKLNVLPRSFVNASTEDLYNGINKASIGDVQQNSICMHASRVDVPRTKSRQEFASSLGVVPAPSATQTLRPHTAGVARSNARTGHIIKEFFTRCDDLTLSIPYLIPVLVDRLNAEDVEGVDYLEEKMKPVSI